MKLKPLVMMLVPIAFGLTTFAHAETLQEAVSATIKTNPDVLAASRKSVV